MAFLHWVLNNVSQEQFYGQNIYHNIHIFMASLHSVVSDDLTAHYFGLNIYHTDHI